MFSTLENTVRKVALNVISVTCHTKVPVLPLRLPLNMHCNINLMFLTWWKNLLWWNEHFFLLLPSNKIFYCWKTTCTIDTKECKELHINIIMHRNTLTLKRNKYNGSSRNGNVDHYHGMGVICFLSSLHCFSYIQAKAMAGDNAVRSLLEKMTQCASNAYLGILERYNLQHPCLCFWQPLLQYYNEL